VARMLKLIYIHGCAKLTNNFKASGAELFLVWNELTMMLPG